MRNSRLRLLSALALFLWLLSLVLILRDRPPQPLAHAASPADPVTAPGRVAIPPSFAESPDFQALRPPAERERVAPASQPTAASTVTPQEIGPADGRHAVKRVISSNWLDPEDKAERRRIRIVEADFKYPRLRLEEVFSRNPVSGEEVVIPVKASVADHLLVGLEAGVEVAAIRPVIEAQGYRIRAVEAGSYLLVSLPEHEDSGAQERHMARLQRLDGIAYAEADWLVYPAVLPNDPAFADGTLWGLDNPGTVAGMREDADIDAPEAWDVRTDAPAVVVAVTDTGIRHSHEDLAANMWTNGDGYHGYDAYDLDNDPDDPNGHGTHIAGTIGAVGDNGLGTTGVAWNVELMALRFIGQYGGATSDAISVINYARIHGADVINASWGGAGYSQSLENAIRACHTAEIPFVAAAGNLKVNNDAVPHYPSGFRAPNIVSVAATGADDWLAPFSNYGRLSVDVAAPGDNIWSCGIASDSDYRFLSGTSMATPHIAGALALAKAHFSGESCEDLINRLYISVDKPGSLTSKVSTSGRLNLHRLLVDSDPVPPHAYFGNALWFGTRYWEWSGSNSRMVKEDDEDQLNGGRGTRSMWFFWRAPADGMARVKAEAQLGDLILEAYLGSGRSGRQLIRDNSKEGSARISEFFFNARKGQTYTFCLDSAHAQSQQMSIQGWLYPINDMFDHAIELGSGTRIAGSGDNTGATTESFEQDMRHAGRRADRSIWWKWTPDFSGSFVLGTQRSEIDTVLAVYSGPKDNLVEVASNDDVSALDWTSQVTMEVESGTTYHIVVDSYSSHSTGRIEFDGYRPEELFILKQPQAASVQVGGEATFRVAVAGTDLRYQWEFNGQPIPGAVFPSYTVQGVLSQDFGNYRVRISNLANQIYSNTAALSEIVTPPRVVWQSRSVNASSGETVMLRVEVTGSEPMAYQWYKDDVVIPGATNNLLELTNVASSDEAVYRMTATNAQGTAPSSGMLLGVYDSPWDGWQYLDPANQTGEVFGIIHQGGQWVAASRAYPGTRISLSDDGRIWRHHLIQPEAPVTGCYGSFLVYGNGMWLFGGQSQQSSGTGGVVYKSTDLINWQQVDLGFALYGHKVIFHDGAFFLMNGNSGSYNRVHRSVDGVTWQKQYKPGGLEIVAQLGMASSSHGLVVCGHPTNSSESAFFLPASSTTWQILDMDPARSEKCSSVHWFKDRYIANAGGIYESLDGTNWSGPLATADQAYPGYPTTQSWLVEHGDHVYGTKSSLDGGLTWASNSSIYPQDTKAAASDGSVVVFGTGKGGLHATENPFNASYEQPMMTSIEDMRWEGGQFLLQTSTSYKGYAWSAVAVSPDTESWKLYPLQGIDGDALNHGGNNVKWINGEFWRNGHYVSSPTGTKQFFRGPVPSSSWQAEVTDLDGTYLADYVEGPEGILAIRVPHPNLAGDLVKSTDGGDTWTTVSMPGDPPRAFTQLECLGGVYVHYSQLVDDLVSADLVNWISIGQVDYITEHEGIFYAWRAGSFMTSTDMLNWSAWNNLPNRTMSKPVSFGGAMVCNNAGRINYSYDGINWVPADVGFSVSYLATTGDVLLVGGSGGQLARTGSLSNLAPVVSIVEPLADSESVEGGLLQVNLDAFNADGVGHPTVKLFGDGVLVGEKSSPPYEFEMPVGQPGGHLLHVEVRQGSGPTALDHRHIRSLASVPTNSYGGASGGGLLPGETRYVNGIYFSTKQFVRNSLNNSPLVMMSDDLDTWLPVSKKGLVEAVFGNNRLITLETTDSGPPYTPLKDVSAVTSDGVNWLRVKMPAASICPLNFSHGHFWTFAANGVMTSEDGVNWNFRGFKQAPGGGTSTNFVNPVGDPNGTMVAQVLNKGVWRTTDGGANWHEIIDHVDFPSVPMSDGGDFFLWGSIGGTKHFGSSIDGGENWSFHPYPSSYLALSMINRVVFAHGSFGRLMAVSQDGENWQELETPMKMESIIAGDDGYFYSRVTEWGVEGVYRSADGIQWEMLPQLPTTDAFSLFSSPDGLFATSAEGGLWRLRRKSEEWEVVAQPLSQSITFQRVAGAGEDMVAISSQLIFASDDGGRSWDKVFDPTGTALASIDFTDLFYRNGVWLAWDDGVALLRSTDGKNFADITSTVGGAEFEVIAPGADRWLAIKGDGSVWASEDGLAWSSHAAAGSFPDSDVVMLREANGQWFALSVDADRSSWYNKRLIASVDGQNWQVTNMPYMSNVRVIAGVNGVLIVGDGSTAKYSADLSSWSNTYGNASLFAGADAFYNIRYGWLERSENGKDWVQSRQVDSALSYGQYADGTMFLMGPDRISRIAVADVRVGDVSMTAGDFAVGDTIEFSMELVNTGGVILAAGNYPVEVYLSLDGYHVEEEDSRLGRAMVAVPEIEPGASTSVDVVARIPNKVSPGEFRISVIFDRDGAAHEKSAANNYGMSEGTLVTIAAWNLTTTSNGQGEVNQDSNSLLFANGSVVSLVATAGKGAAFTGWGGDAFGAESQISILMNGDKTVQANFSPRHSLQVHVDGHGEVTGLAELGSYPSGASANLSAVAADGWEFAGWSGAASGSNPAASITMDASKALTATFRLPRDNWRSKHFSAGELLDELISGDDADPDRDGLKNWEEYLHGSDPRDHVSKGRKHAALEGGFLSLVYTRLSAPESGLSLRCVGSRNMQQWDAPDLEERVLSSESGIETVEARIPMAESSSGFLKFDYISTP